MLTATVTHFSILRFVFICNAYDSRHFAHLAEILGLVLDASDGRAERQVEVLISFAAKASQDQDQYTRTKSKYKIKIHMVRLFPYGIDPSQTHQIKNTLLHSNPRRQFFFQRRNHKA
jgi:hypothetical protein